MSIATDVSRIKGNITAALAAIADKGVTVPDGSTSDALASLIASIEAGGGGGYNFDGNPRWISSGEFTPANTITVNNLDPILFTPSVTTGNNTDAARGRFFFMFDATKTTSYNNTYTGIMYKPIINSVATVSNYLFLYNRNVSEFTTYSYIGGT